MNGYRGSDAGEVTLTVTDADGLQGVLNFPLVPNAYPLTPVCAANGEDCVVPSAGGRWDQSTWDNAVFGD